MTEREIKYNLGEKVRWTNEKMKADGVYTLSGAIIRRGSTGFFYQAELTDSCRNIVIVNLDDIEPADKKEDEK